MGWFDDNHWAGEAYDFGFGYMCGGRGLDRELGAMRLRSDGMPVKTFDGKSRRAAVFGRAQLLANSSSTAGGIQKAEQTAPLRDGPAAWAWGFWTLR